jgi:hypothetical protein
MELSLVTVQIIAWSKILLFLSFLAIFYFIIKYPKSWIFSLAFSFIFSVFYFILSFPLQTMWWGNNGDELFVLGYLGQNLFSSPFNDFYYHNLPVFYPPLYFWISGFFGKFFAQNAISLAKFGVMSALFIWFIGTFLWTKLYYKSIDVKKRIITSNSWFWVLIPFIFFILMDFNDIILKPYETLPALFLVIYVGLFAEAIKEKKWKKKHFAFFGLTGGVLFLSFYFWWFVAILALFTLAFLSSSKYKNTIRIAIIGVIMFIFSAPYLIPLVASLLKGSENWQALCFVHQEFNTFLPFSTLSWKSLILLSGVLGLLLFYNKPFIKANLLLLFFTFLYQFINIVVFIVGGSPIQPAKQFLFLGSATLAVGSAYLVIWLWKRYITDFSLEKRNIIAIMALILSVTFWPMASFIDDPVVRNQIEKDLKAPRELDFSEKIKDQVPDYRDRTWLSSGMPVINAYIPLHYYIAHNPHFSHPASIYSERMSTISDLSLASDSDFVEIIEKTSINALLLYKNSQHDTYPLFFWQDNFLNGGKELLVEIPKSGVESLGWKKVYDDKDWVILLK